MRNLLRRLIGKKPVYRVKANGIKYQTRIQFMKQFGNRLDVSAYEDKAIQATYAGYKHNNN